MRNASAHKKLQEAHRAAVYEGIVLTALVAAFRRCPRWRVLKRLRLLYALRKQETIARAAARAHKQEFGRLR